MPSQAESQVNIQRDRRPYDFLPLPQDVAQDLESNLGSSDSGDRGCRIRLSFMEVAILSLLIVLCLELVYFRLDEAFGPHDMKIHPESFSVSKFNVSDSHLITVIESDLTFGCKDCDYELAFDYIDGDILYKNETALSTVSVEPFSLGRKELKTLHVKFATYIKEKECPLMRGQPILKEIMEDDLKNGTTYLTMRISNMVYCKRWGIPFASLNLNCWELTVKFSPISGVGRLIDSSKKEC